jgi:hypothetical protein
LTQSKGWKDPSKGFYENIPRGDNEHADLYAKSVTQGVPLPLEVFFESLKAPSVELMERVVLIVRTGEQKSYPFSKGTILQMTKLILEECKPRQDCIESYKRSCLRRVYARLSSSVFRESKDKS